MTSRAKTISAAIAVIVIGAFVIYNRTASSGTVESILHESRKNFGSPILIGVVDYQQKLVDSLINKGDFVAASHLIDTSSNMSNASKHNNRGLILMAKGESYSAISEFTAALAKEKYNKARNYRASAYLKAGFPDSAIFDYMELVSFNYDFTRELAEAYEGQGEKDSAIKYYRIYLEHYPDSITVSRKLKTLYKGG